MRNIVTLVSLTMLLSLGGCVINVNSDDWKEENNWKERQERNERMINKMVLGKTRTSVEADLGTPDIVESFVRSGETFTVLFYRTRHIDSDGLTTKDETTPLVFAEGLLVGWGDSAVDHATQ